MSRLNILPPHVLTRVSGYIPEIIKFIEKIIENGYGYESNSSIYFDTIKFHKQHSFIKLEPKRMNDIAYTSREKINQCDFVLWKKSKPGESVLESPWGLGRPGWHIECSVMASHILATLDYSDRGMEKDLYGFFLSIKSHLRSMKQLNHSDAYTKFNENDLLLNENFPIIKQQINSALCDSVDTQLNILVYITHLLDIFGLNSSSLSADNNTGFSRLNEQQTETVGIEDIVAPYVEQFAAFRDDVRKIAIEIKFCDPKVLEQEEKEQQLVKQVQEIKKKTNKEKKNPDVTDSAQITTPDADPADNSQ